MGFVEINKDYRVALEANCLTIQKLAGINKKTNKELWKPIGYYTTWTNVFERLCKEFVAEKIETEGKVTLTELKTLIQDTKTEIKNLVMGLW